MAKKIPPASLQASNDSLTEIDQLRQLVFGQAKLELDHKIDALSQRLSTELDMLQTQFNERMVELSEQLKQQHESTLRAIEDTQNTQEDNKAELIEQNKLLQSQLEMAENAGRDDTDALHKRIDSEVSQLDTNLQQGLQEMLERLDNVSKELSNSKTDRKTLAQLLATMATDLESNN